MPADKIAYMANQIATFMKTRPHDEAVEGCASHINDFWEPRMRKELFLILDGGGTDLSPLIREAAPRIRRPTESG
ncbi:MAG: formate dehydrogenase subunit delta [Pseudorhodobacter sp.]